MDKFLKTYWTVGVIYGGLRSNYWLQNVNEKTYTKDGYKYHPLTTTSIIKYTLIQGVWCSSLFPLCMLSDLSYYEKSKMGIREFSPPYPFHNLKWKDDID